MVRSLCFCQPKIRKFRQPVCGEQDVRRLDVTVNDPKVVCLGQAIANLAGQIDRLFKWQGSIPAAVQQTAAVHVFHDQKRPILGTAVVINLDDVRVVQGCDRLGLGQEPSHGRLATSCLAKNSLDRDLAVEPRVESQKHLAHAAAAECFLDLVPGLKIDDLDVVNDCLLVTQPVAERSLVAETDVGCWAAFRRASEGVPIAKAVLDIIGGHQSDP